MSTDAAPLPAHHSQPGSVAAPRAALAGLTPAPVQTVKRRVSGFYRVACHRCGRPTVCAGRRTGFSGEGARCSACRRS